MRREGGQRRGGAGHRGGHVGRVHIGRVFCLVTVDVPLDVLRAVHLVPHHVLPVELPVVRPVPGRGAVAGRGEVGQRHAQVLVGVGLPGPGVVPRVPRHAVPAEGCPRLHHLSGPGGLLLHQVAEVAAVVRL